MKGISTIKKYPLSAVEDHLVYDLYIFINILVIGIKTQLRAPKLKNASGMDPASSIVFRKKDFDMILGIYVLFKETLRPFII